MLNVAMCACDQCTIFSTGEKFCPDYGLLLELHALTLVDHSYALLVKPMASSLSWQCLRQSNHHSHTVLYMYYTVDDDRKPCLSRYFQWLLSWLLHGYLAINSSVCLHFFHFRPDDDWSIQLKHQQVIF